MTGTTLVAALTFGAPADARAGCVTNNLHCVELAWSLDSYWDTFWALDVCYQTYMRCLQQQLLGV